MSMYTRVTGRLKAFMSGSSATKHVLAVSSGAVIAQAIGAFAGPINSRLYLPAEYGTLAVFSMMFSLFAILAFMRYDLAIPVAEDDTEGMHIVLVCLLLTSAWTLVAILAITFAGDPLARWLAKGNPQFRHYIWFLPLGIFTASVFITLSNWAVRKRAFVELSVARVLQSLFGSGCMIILGFLHKGTLGLLTGSIVFTGSGVRKLFFIALKDFRQLRPGLSLQGMLDAARKHYRYPMYTTWAALINAFSSQVPIFFLTRGFGPESTGYFTLCNRILTLPAAVIGAAVAPVFFSRIKQAQQEGNLREKTIHLLDNIVGINAFFMVFLALFGEAFFTIAFGPKWGRSGQYASALAPWILMSFLVTPLENLPLLFNRQAAQLGFQATLLVIRIGAMYTGIALHNDLLAMALFGGISALYFLVFLAWLLRLVQVPLGRPFLQLGKELLLAGVLLGGCRLVMWRSHNNPYITGAVLVPVLAFGAYRGIKQLMRGRLAAKGETAVS